MTNAIATPASLSLEECDKLLVDGMHSVRDAILGYTHHGLTQAEMSKRIQSLGLKGSVRTIRRHVADLRAEGLLPEAVQSDKPEAIKSRKRREKGSKGQNGLMTPVESTSLTDTAFPRVSMDQALELLNVKPGYVPEKDSIHRDSDDPYLKVLHWYECIFHLLSEHERDGTFTDAQWLSMCGGHHHCSSVLHPRRDGIRRSERDRAVTIDVDAH